MDTIFKGFMPKVKQIDRDKRQVRMIMTRLEVDRDGEVVVPMGGEFENFMANPIVLFSHMRTFPIANVIELIPDDVQLEGVVQFFEQDESPLAERMFKLYSKGKMRAGSIGFIPTGTGEPILPGQVGRTFTTWELLEFSLVAVGSNPSALTTERAKEMAGAIKSLMPEEFSDPEEALLDLFGMGKGKIQNLGKKDKSIIEVHGVKTDAETIITEISEEVLRTVLNDSIDIKFVDDPSVIERAGRVLSAANLKKIKTAAEMLASVIKSQEAENGKEFDDMDPELKELLGEGGEAQLREEVKLLRSELSMTA